MNPETPDPAADLMHWARVVADAIRSVRSGAPMTKEEIADVIRSARSLAIGSGAVMDAMLRVGHTESPDGATLVGKTLMSWGELGEAFGHTRASVRERYLKITDPDYDRPPEDLWLYGSPPETWTAKVWRADGTVETHEGLDDAAARALEDLPFTTQDVTVVEVTQETSDTK